MFTGIVEATATVENIETQGTSVHFTMSCPFTDELKIDQSLSHNGCCLTIEKIENQLYGVTAIQETLEKTNLGSWKIGTKVNLERCVLMNGRLDGHIVQGHVDQTGTIKSIENLNGSHYITIAYTEKDGFTTVPQGSITMDGISLTVAHSGENEFSVAIIPYTWEHTNLKNLEIGSKVNLEFDIIGKYVAKLMKK
jgi:riboflavin synthase, alpha subunit